MAETWPATAGTWCATGRKSSVRHAMSGRSAVPSRRGPCAPCQWTVSNRRGRAARRQRRRAEMLHCAALRLFVVAGLVLLAACAQQPGKPLAARQAEAIEANRRAELRFRSGDFDGAVQQYQVALRIAQSVEDVDGIAANAINLSIAYQRLGKHAEARASLAPVLDHPRLSFPSARLAQAALRRAVLDFDERRHADAAEWLEKAATWCGQQGCTLSAAINNVRGLLALEQGRTDAAAASATTAS